MRTTAPEMPKDHDDSASRRPERTQTASGATAKRPRVLGRNLLVAVIVGIGGALGVTAVLDGSTSGESPPGMGANTSERHHIVPTCDPPPARCGTEDNDLLMVWADEAARRAIELSTTGTTTIPNSLPVRP